MALKCLLPSWCRMQLASLKWQMPLNPLKVLPDPFDWLEGISHSNFWDFCCVFGFMFFLFFVFFFCLLVFSSLKYNYMRVSGAIIRGF